uniref:Uncharacterized protein n=1 Tax=Solanum tuberosum TaxID=4113 RepID=M1BC51_SOLTU
MAKTKADEKDLEAKEEQMALLEMSGDLTTESKQLTGGFRDGLVHFPSPS